MAILPNKVRPGDAIQASTVNGIIDAISDLAKIAQGKRIYRLHANETSAGKANDDFPFRVKIVGRDCASKLTKVQIQRGQVVDAWVVPHDFYPGPFYDKKQVCNLIWENYTVDTYAADTCEKRCSFLNIPDDFTRIFLRINRCYTSYSVSDITTETEIAHWMSVSFLTFQCRKECSFPNPVDPTKICIKSNAIPTNVSTSVFAPGGTEASYAVLLACIKKNENSEFVVCQKWRSDIVFWKVMPVFYFVPCETETE